MNNTVDTGNKAEITFQCSEDKFNRLFEYSPIGLAMVDYQTGQFLEANRSLLESTGYTRDEFLALRYGDITPRVYGLRENKQVEDLNARGVFGPNEREYIRKDGTRYPVRTRGFVLTADDGAQVVWCIIEDISELKKIEEESATIIQTASDAFWLNDSQGRILLVNDAFCDMVGYSREELLTMSLSDITPHKTQRDILDRIADIKRRGSLRFESKHCRKDGTAFDVEASASYLPTRDGVCVFVRDITERKLADKLLGKSEEQYRLLVSQMQQGLAVHEILCDQSGTPVDYRFLSINKSFEDMTGLKGEEILGRTVREVLPNTEPYWIDIYGKVALTGQPYQYENFSAELGKYYRVSAYSPKPNQFAVIIDDITQYKLAEEKIRLLSYRDQLTGLYNRRYYEEAVAKIENDERYLPITLLMADVNGLKLVNDVFGHDYGDKLLCAVADILTQCAREEDVVARIGGDEFLVLLHNTDADTETTLCDQIYALCGSTAFKLGDVDHKLSISVGIATKTSAAQSFSDVARDAENSMYKRKLLESRSTHSSMVENIRITMYEKSHETRDHTDRMAALARRLGEACGLRYDQLNDLELLSSLHDLGKIGIDSSILEKPGTLTDEEWKEVRKHPEIGYRIALASPELAYIADGILCHHERWDGKGYPQGLWGESIPVSARIIALVDSFDAMTNDRVYKKAMSTADALQEIADHAGTQFDPDVVKAFLRIMG